MITKHTPAPWVNNEDFDRDRAGQSIVTIDSEHGFIAIVYGKDRQTCEANARLIAEAPEMLEALERLMVWAATHHDADFEGEGETHHMISEWSRARAATRKARGEQ